MRNSQRDVLDIMREAHRFAQSIGAVDEETVFFFGSLNTCIHLDIHSVTHIHIYLFAKISSPLKKRLKVFRHRLSSKSISQSSKEGRPPEITPENAKKMGVADIDDPSVYIK